MIDNSLYVSTEVTCRVRLAVVGVHCTSKYMYIGDVGTLHDHISKGWREIKNSMSYYYIGMPI